MTTYPLPGRGAWRITGGLLPARPGSTSKIGYYRQALATETPVGAGWLRGTDTSHHAEVVCLAVRAIQGLVGAEPDGWLDADTSARIRLAQTLATIEVDGIVGAQTMRALLLPLIQASAKRNGVPEAILGGVLNHESSLDPGAVGVNGVDHGLAQINLEAHTEKVSLQQSLTPAYSIEWTAKELAGVHATWAGKTAADPWDIAIAAHNSPALARRWAQAGVAPFVEGRVFQIVQYVQAVRCAW